jgi:hypothetical protein
VWVEDDYAAAEQVCGNCLAILPAQVEPEDEPEAAVEVDPAQLTIEGDA